MSRARAVVALLVAGVLAVAAACGVEVPDDVAADIEASTTTEIDAPGTTETPTSDDELEQALIDNGYSLEEAECGAANLRDTLAPDEVQSIVDADTIEDISARTAREFAAALRPCVEDGADPGSVPDDDDDDGDGDDGGGPGGDGGGRFGGGLPDFGDDSEGDVSRSRFLAALISSGLPDEEARCVVQRVYEQLDQDEINDLFHAESADEVPDEVLDVLDAITEACLR